MAVYTRHVLVDLVTPRSSLAGASRPAPLADMQMAGVAGCVEMLLG